MVSGISSASAAGASGVVAAKGRDQPERGGGLPGAGRAGPVGAAGCGTGGRRRVRGRLLDVGADDPAAGAAAGDGGQVDPVLTGELAGQR